MSTLHTLLRCMGKALCIGITLPLLAGCVNEIMPDAPTNTSPAQPREITIRMTLPGNDSPQTRIDYEDDFSAGSNAGVKVKWVVGDQVRIFCTDDDVRKVLNTEVFTLTSIDPNNSNIATFTGIDPKPADITDPISYTAIYPASIEVPESFPSSLDLRGQVQTGNKNMAHLSAYNLVIAADYSTIEGTNLDFGLQVSTMLRFDLTLPDGYDVTTDGDPYAIELSSNADNECFRTALWDNFDMVSSIRLSVKDATIGPDKKLTGYIMTSPFTVPAGKQLDVTVLCSKGQKYTSAKAMTQEVSASKGKRYTITRNAGDWIKTSFSTSNIFMYKQSASINFPSGDGKSANPYIISSAADLAKLLHDVNNGISYTGTYFKLTTDIHVAASEWECIGTTKRSFKGHFDGDGHTIFGQLIGKQDAFGFFGNVTDGSVSNLTLDVMVTNSFNSSDLSNPSLYSIYTGSIAGMLSGSTLVNCKNKGTVTGTEQYIGGIVGFAGRSSLFACTNQGTVKGSGASGYLNAGGVAGGNASSGIVACINTGAIACYNTTDANKYVGGIAGLMRSYTSAPAPIIAGCYSTGTVAGSSTAGSLAGYGKDASMKISNCYWVSASTTPPAVGAGAPTVENSERYETVELLNTNVDKLNTGIAAWNADNTKKCNYLFVAGDPLPTLRGID